MIDIVSVEGVEDEESGVWTFRVEVFYTIDPTVVAVVCGRF